MSDGDFQHERNVDALMQRLASVEAEVYVLQSTVAQIDGDFPQQIQGGGGDASSAAYTSYFRVVDASTESACKIGVTDGGWIAEGEPTYCGVVKVNGESLSLAVFTDAVSAVGTYWVWLHSWIDEEYAKHTEIIVGDEGSSAKPDNPNDGVAWASELLGRFTVVASGETVAIGTIIQDYLKGGEHTEILVGSCSGGAVVEA